MSLNFPANPTNGDTYTSGSITYIYQDPPGKWTASTQVNLDSRYVNASGDTMAGNLTVPSLNDGPFAVNQLINGNFRVWQRGTSFTSGGYTADRWLASGSGGSTRTVSQYDTVEATGMQVIFTSGGNANSRTMIQQKIEDVRTFAGQEVTLSFEARSTNITQISTDVQQFFGSGGSPSATTTFGGKRHTDIENDWKKFSATFTVPSVDGKTIGTTDALDCLQVNFFLEAGSDFDGRTDSLGTQSGNIILRNVQLEPGPVATPYSHRPYATELALCRRYYQVLPNQSKTIRAVGSSFAFADGSVPLQPPMRAVPTCSFSVLANSEILTAPVVSPDPPASVHGVTVGNGAVGTSGQTCYFAGTADAEL